MSEAPHSSRRDRVLAGVGLAGGILILGVLPVWLGLRLAVPPEGAAAMPMGKMELEVIVDERHLVRRVGRTSVDRLDEIFGLYDYDLQAVMDGQAEVPPIFVRAMPGDVMAIEDADSRKRVFVQTLLPLALRANAEIAADRRRLLALIEETGGDFDALSYADAAWLEDLAERYRVDGVDLETLERRVDIVPVSLAVAQAANESGWGTSRFARDGNALFGQWVWNPDEGIEPERPQETASPYAVRRFPSLAGSVSAYMRNLNTHDAYRDFRRQRAAERAEGREPDGFALAGTLIQYSQRREAYVEELRTIIRFNGYDRLDGLELIPLPGV